MEKEILQKIKEDILISNKKLQKNKNIIEKKEREIEELTLGNIQIIDELNSADRIVFLYERVNDSKKFLLFALVLGIVFGLGFGIVSLVDQAKIFSIIFSFIGPAFASTLIGSIPYLGTKANISYNTSLSLEEINQKIDKLKKEKQINRDKYKENLKEIEKLKSINEVIETELYSKTLELLKDKSSCQEIMTNIIENEPSKNLIEIITNDIVKQKIKK